MHVKSKEAYGNLVIRASLGHQRWTIGEDYYGEYFNHLK